jgi:hypothetical protein
MTTLARVKWARHRTKNVHWQCRARIFAIGNGCSIDQRCAPKLLLWKAASFAVGVGLSALSHPADAAPASGGGFCDAGSAR